MKKYLDKLEYNKILENLANYSVTYLGKEKCLGLLPSNIKEEVQASLKETEEAVNLLYRCNTPPLSEIANNTVKSRCRGGS